MESVMMSVIPYALPSNESEREINDTVLKCYNNGPNGNPNNFTGMLDHPEKFCAVYLFSAGWTREGFRHYSTLMLGYDFLQFVEGVRTFTGQYIDGLVAFMNFANGAVRNDTEPCGDANCIVHGEGMDDPQRQVARMLFNEKFGRRRG